MKIFISLLLIVFAFVYGVLVGTYQYPPFEVLQDIKIFINSSLNISHDNSKKYSAYLSPKTLSQFKSCKLKEINKVPINSTAFIGHAYGSPNKQQDLDRFLSPNVEKFLKTYSHMLKRVILTGDVFNVPSLEKWEKLSNINKNLEIIIAPGNHDVLGVNVRKIFNMSNFGKFSYPIIKKQEFGDFIIEDSISTKWHVDDKVLTYLTSTKNKKIIIARHNPPIKELISLSNSLAGIGRNLDNLKELKNKASKNLIIWIIGDGGAIESLPSLACLQYDNHTFIINGIGERIGDTILFEKNGNIYSYLLN